MDQIESAEYNGFETTNGASHSDHGWKKVVYPKRNRKQKPSDQTTTANGETHVPNGDNVFRSLEEKAEDRHRRILAAKKAAADDSDDSDPARSKLRSNGYDYDDSDTEAAVGKENVKAEEKKPKVKKEKKPKVTLGEAAAKIDASNLEAFLFEASESYASQPEIQLMRFADYFGRALSGVSSSHFPWVKTFKESPLSKLIDIPLSHIPEAVCKTSADWINQRPIDALGAFVLWALDCILADLAVQQGSAKGGKKGAQQHATSKSQVAIFVTVALVLRRKPDALTNVLPTLRENPKYQGQDKLPVVVWMMAQARTILVNGAVRKGERLIPPPSFEILMRLAFPASSARVKATERFEAIYPLLKEVSLAGVPGSKAMKQVTQQIFTFALKAAGEGNAVLAKEAAAVTIWAITQNVDCCKHWENLYNDNLEASVIVLKKLIDQWKERSVKLTPADTLTLNRTMKSLRLKNEEALEGGAKGASMSLYKDADKCCKVISGKLSSGSGVIKGLAIVAVLAAAGAAAISANPEAIAELKGQVESWDLNKITESVMTAFKN
ncbi:hypothetical protein IGI04_026841 [Brassica rapa subsp. trilocularis]|uniref:GCF C-terminal domain-containing protein n=1 Tax=Brassica rapa subsp. trilocularis TaxID=1813537 RepID=A0ABQ7KX82_BRACM|nr:hypothetical protein IGI04_026841 [Brassica rapa subsp. trilocularis]